MKLYKSCLLPATCTIILAVTTYATTTQATRLIQAEVKFQQVAVDSPSRSLKYGDKTTKKIPNQEVNFLPTTSSIEKFEKNLPPLEKQTISRNRSRLRVEQQKQDKNQPNLQISQRLDIVNEQNQLDDDLSIVQKNRELINKPTTTAVGQPRTSNRSLATKTSKQTQNQQQHTQYYNLKIESERNLAKTKTIPTAITSHKSRQRTLPTTTIATPTKPTTNAYQIPPLSTHNSNVRTHHLTANNSSIARHSHSNQRNKNNYNNINNNNSQPLLTSSNAVAASGLQRKTESSPNTRKRTGNILNNQSVSSNTTNDFRSHARKLTSNASTITIISSTSTTTTTTTQRPIFQFPNSFNIFTPEFWQFLYPTSSPLRRFQTTTSTTTTSTRRPPKKYKAPTQISTKEEKLSLVKQKPTLATRTTTKLPNLDTKHNSNTPKKDEGPFRIALPTFNILSSKRETNGEGEKEKRNVEKESINLRERFDCPRESEVRFQLFPKICKIDEDCNQWNREEICCDIFGAKSCVSGIPKPLEETSHAPILGVIPRKCPDRPLAELWWEVKECETDMDCWPRVCCPDGQRRYCRTSQPELNTVPVPVQRSFNYLAEYLECTPPPPPIFDLHPKTCTSTLDCFPNVCCQEAGLRHCRPPKKSVLTMLANVFNVDFVKRLTQNIVIK